jgi:hypothetical protein
MDPERLALFRDHPISLYRLIPDPSARDFVMELLADRDWHANLLLGLLAVMHRDDDAPFVEIGRLA